MLKLLAVLLPIGLLALLLFLKFEAAGCAAAWLRALLLLLKLLAVLLPGCGLCCCF